MSSNSRNLRFELKHGASPYNSLALRHAAPILETIGRTKVQISVDRFEMASVVLLCMCISGLVTSAVGGFVHPYIMEVYSRSTTPDGSFQPDVRIEDLNVWGFTDAGKGGVCFAFLVRSSAGACLPLSG